MDYMQTFTVHAHAVDTTAFSSAAAKLTDDWHYATLLEDLGPSTWTKLTLSWVTPVQLTMGQTWLPPRPMQTIWWSQSGLPSNGRLGRWWLTVCPSAVRKHEDSNVCCRAVLLLRYFDWKCEVLCVQRAVWAILRDVTTVARGILCLIHLSQ